jgi:hypothetical protein
MMIIKIEDSLGEVSQIKQLINSIYISKDNIIWRDLSKYILSQSIVLIVILNLVNP